MVRRDGVGINRDTETAHPKIKYDFEVAEPQTGGYLEFSLQAENAGDDDFALLYILLKEMQRGFEVGAKRSRGLGRVRLKLMGVECFDGMRPEPYGHSLEQFLEAGLKTDVAPRIFEGWCKDGFDKFLSKEENKPC